MRAKAKEKVCVFAYWQEDCNRHQIWFTSHQGRLGKNGVIPRKQRTSNTYLFLLCMCTGGFCTEGKQWPWVSFLRCPLLIFALRQNLSLALAPNSRDPPVSSSRVTSLCQYAWLFHMGPEAEIQFPGLPRRAHYQHSPQTAAAGEGCRNKFPQP